MNHHQRIIQCESPSANKRWNSIMRRYFLAGRRFFKTMNKFSQTADGSRFQVDVFCGLLGAQQTSASIFACNGRLRRCQPCPPNLHRAFCFLDICFIDSLFCCVFWSVNNNCRPDNKTHRAFCFIDSLFSCVFWSVNNNCSPEDKTHRAFSFGGISAGSQF